MGTHTGSWGRVEYDSNSCSNVGVERRKHWWNGNWGRLARRDLYLFEDGGRWLVEARRGGAEGQSRRFECADEEAALECLRGLMAEGERWSEI